jgi:P3 major capsid protein
MQVQQPMTQAQSQAQAAARMSQQNMAARQLVLKNGYPMLQSIYANTVQPAAQTQLNIPPQNVGLIRGFLVRMVATVTNPAAGSSLLTLTQGGPSNLLQSILFTDLQNYQRINTQGWHLSLLNTVKQGRPFLSSTPSDSPMGFGSVYPVIKAPATIAANTSGTIDMYYWVPLAYGHTDLSGAIYANVVNATMNLQLNLSTAAQAVVANTADPTLAIYQGAGAVAGVTLTNVQLTVYQDYIDQLPQGQGGAPILPALDLNTMYEIKNTTFTGIPANSDFYMGYSNFRHFMSTSVIFDNQLAGVYPIAGSDVNYFSFRTANYTDTRKADPYTWSALARRVIQTDVPLGWYFFDTRTKPIYTTQTGNTNLVLNASTVNANAQTLVGWEMLANVSNLVNAASLASGG